MHFNIGQKDSKSILNLCVGADGREPASLSAAQRLDCLLLHPTGLG